MSEPDRVNCLGKAPRGARAQPGIYVKVYYSQQRGIDDANKHVHRVERAAFTNSAVFRKTKKPRWTTLPQEEQRGIGKTVSFRPWSPSDALRRGLELYTMVRLECTSWISVERDPWGLYTSGIELAAAYGRDIKRIFMAAARGRHSYIYEQPRAHTRRRQSSWGCMGVCVSPSTRMYIEFTLYDACSPILTSLAVDVGLPTLFALYWSGSHLIPHSGSCCVQLN